MNGGHARLPADQNDLVNLTGLEACIAKSLAHRSHTALDQVAGQLFEFRPPQRDTQVPRASGVGGDEGQVHLGLADGREFHLRLLRRFAKALERHPVLAQVNPVGALELARQPLNNALVKIIAAEVGVAAGRFHLNHAVAQFEYRNIKGAAAHIVDDDHFIFALFIQAIG